MVQINTIRSLGFWIFFLPALVLNLCLLISINYLIFEDTIFEVSQLGRLSFTIPYIDGGTSISRTARGYPTSLIFKPGMIITAYLLIKYWIANNMLAQTIKEKKNNYIFLYFGILSAVFLIAHSIFLGIKFDHELYKLFRRVVLIAFILFEIIAQTLLVITLFKYKDKIAELINKKILYLKMILVSVLIVTALTSLPVVTSSGNTSFKHALEWNYFVGVILFYLLTFLFWKKEKTSVHTPEGA